MWQGKEGNFGPRGCHGSGIWIDKGQLRCVGTFETREKLSDRAAGVLA
jgi:hypothetical protein